MHNLRIIILSLLAIAFTGCSSYNRDWRSYQDATPDDAFTGKWKGSWTSNHNGHTGGLRAMITHEEGDRYNAHFHATYAKILQFQHRNTFTTSAPTGRIITFEGENDLGKLAGGVFKYKGTVSGNKFNSDYTAKKDHGVFTMERVKK